MIVSNLIRSDQIYCVPKGKLLTVSDVAAAHHLNAPRGDVSRGGGELT